MALGAGVPSEDEFALCTMTGLSPYLAWCFPGAAARLRPLPDVPGRARAEEVARWGHALTTFLKKLTLKYGRPLVLKSPPHTARIRLLLGLFPDARFVHIHRDPYAVFRSTRHMIRAVAARSSASRRARCRTGTTGSSAVYTEMYDAFFEERGLIPEGRLCEVGFEDLERDPVGVVGSVYEALRPAGLRGRPAPPGGLPRLDRRLPQEPATTTSPSRCGVASPTSGAGASTSGGTGTDGPPRVRRPLRHLVPHG